MQQKHTFLVCIEYQRHECAAPQNPVTIPLFDCIIKIEN